MSTHTYGDNARRYGSADRAASASSKQANKELYGQAFDFETSNPTQIAGFKMQHGIDQAVAPVQIDAYSDLKAALAAYNSGRGSGDSSGKDYALARDQWNAEMAGKETAAATQLRALQGMQSRLAGGGYRGNADALLGLIDDRNTMGQADIWNTYNDGVGSNKAVYNQGMQNIGQGYDTARDMTNTGYGQLIASLRANQVNPYAGMQQSVSPVQNAMQSYLSAYGVSNDPVNQQVQASGIANQQNADSFNQLQQLQSANQMANNQSNIDVAGAAQNFGLTGLGAQRAGYEANAGAARMQSDNQTEATRAQAMNQFLAQISNAKYGVEEDAGARKTQLEDAIIQLGGLIDGSQAKAEPKAPSKPKVKPKGKGNKVTK